jgi:preprotein translocase subunit SecY
VGKIVETLQNIWSVPELRRKLLFTFLILAASRALANVPLPGVDPTALRNLLANSALFGLFDLFSGSNLQNFSIASIGLSPYITASVIFQLLAMVYPKLEEMRKEQTGQEKINQWTRLLTVPLTFVQGFGFYAIISQQLNLPTLAWWQMGLFLVTLTCGTMVLMWLGELITEYGIGNGISVIIATGIISRLPTVLAQTQAIITSENSLTFLMIGVLILLVVGAIVAVNEGERRIPIHYAKRIQAGGKLSDASTYLPLKVNQAGVMPIIFALALIVVPSAVSTYLSQVAVPGVKTVALWLTNNFTPKSVLYNGLYFLLVVGFTYIYTAVNFNPERIAEDNRKYGGFIPGIRPGRPTQDYLNWVMARVTLSGAIFLGLIAILPSFLQTVFSDAAVLAVGGTSVLIVVSVVLETVKQVESLMVMRDYDSFLR